MQTRSAEKAEVLQEPLVISENDRRGGYSEPIMFSWYLFLNTFAW